MAQSDPLRRPDRNGDALSQSYNLKRSCPSLAVAQVWAWGDARDGQLGLGADGVSVNADWNGAVPWPCLVPPSTRKEAVLSVSAGAHRAAGCTHCCGNDHRNVTVGAATLLSAAHRLTRALSPTRAGGHHSLLLTASGRVLVSGRNRHGALGTGDLRQRSDFTEVGISSLFLPDALVSALSAQ